MNPSRYLHTLLVFTVMATMTFTALVYSAVLVVFSGQGYAVLIAPTVLFAITAWAVWVSYRAVWRNYYQAGAKAEENLKGTTTRSAVAGHHVDQVR